MPDDVYAWALSNGWPARGALSLKQLASDIAGGRRPRVTGPSPLRADILVQWRRKAAGDGGRREWGPLALSALIDLRCFCSSKIVVLSG